MSPSRKEIHVEVATPDHTQMHAVPQGTLTAQIVLELPSVLIGLQFTSSPCSPPSTPVFPPTPIAYAPAPGCEMSTGCPCKFFRHCKMSPRNCPPAKIPHLNCGYRELQHSPAPWPHVASTISECQGLIFAVFQLLNLEAWIKSK